VLVDFLAFVDSNLRHKVWCDHLWHEVQGLNRDNGFTFWV
jgi:hypothetical protein